MTQKINRTPDCKGCGQIPKLDRWCQACRDPIEQELHDKFDVAWGAEMAEAIANFDFQPKLETMKRLTHDHEHKKCGDYEQFVDDDMEDALFGRTP